MDFFQRFLDYIRSTKLEVKNVTWPTRAETLRFTLLVLAVSALIAAYLGLLDFFFINILERFIL